MAVRRKLPRWGGIRPCLRIIRAVFAALADPAGVIAHRPGALERAHLAPGDWRDIRVLLAGTETRMCAVMEELGLADLVTMIAGLTVIGAAAILAETGDPARFATPRALVKHAGLCPRDNSSGAAQGKTSISARGRPGLRLAAWRAVWAAMPDNPVMAARFAYLTTRENNRLARQQARIACAAALLRRIHVVITRQMAWVRPLPPGALRLSRPHERRLSALTAACGTPGCGHRKTRAGQARTSPRGTHLGQQHGPRLAARGPRVIPGPIRACVRGHLPIMSRAGRCQ